MEFHGFKWDLGNLAVCQRHGVPLEEIEALFTEGSPLVMPDTKHLLLGRRLLAAGRTAIGKHIYVMFAVRQAGESVRLRPIGARYMHPEEIAAYVEARAAAEE